MDNRFFAGCWSSDQQPNRLWNIPVGEEHQQEAESAKNNGHRIQFGLKGS